MSDDIKVNISGQDTSQNAFQSILNSLNGLTSAAANAGSSVSTAFEGVTSAIGKVSSAMMGIGAVMAGGAIFGAAISKSNEFTEQTYSLAAALGMSYDKATTMNIALQEIGVSSEDYIGMAMKMDRQLRTHSETFDKLGIATKDSSGQMLDQEDIMQNALQVMMSFEAGTDRNMVSQAIFGRSAQEAAKLIRLNADEMDHARGIQEQLGLTVGQDGVEAMHKYKQATADVSLAFTSAYQVVAERVLPIIMDFARFIIDNASPAVYVLSKGLDILNLGFIMIEGAVDIVVMVIRNMVTACIAAGTVIYDVLTGKWGKIADDAKAGLNQMTANFGTMMKSMEDRAKSGMNTIKDLLDMKDVGKEKDGGMPPGGHRKLHGELDKDEEDKKPDPSRMAEWEEMQKEGYLRDLQNHKVSNDEKLADELTFWRGMQGLDGLSVQESDAIQKKITGILIQQLTQRYSAEEQAAKEAEKVSELQEDAVRQEAVAAIAMKKEQLATEVSLGKMSKEQELQALKAFAEQEYEIQLEAESRKLMLLNEGTAAYQKQFNTILAMDQKHTLDMKKLDDQQLVNIQKNWQNMMKPITSAFDSAIKGMISGTMTFGAAVRSIGQSILSSFVDMLLQMVENWIEKQIFMAIFGKATQGTAAAASIGTEAAVGAASAGASVAAIPLIGWAMVPGVMAETFADIMSMQSAAVFHDGGVMAGVPGFQMPATLLSGERVLTGQQNETFGRLDNFLSNSNGGGSQSPSSTIHIHGSPDDKVSNSSVMKMITQLQRDGHFIGMRQA